MPILFTNVRTLPFADVSASGMPFNHQLPNPGYALVGLAMRAGDWIDHVAPMFAELLEDGTMGQTLRGPAFGGDGGLPVELRVEPGHVVVGIQTRSGNFVDAVRLMQAKWEGGGIDTASARWTPWAGGTTQGGVERMERIVEPQGSAVAIGIAGRCGRYVDNLSLVTAEIVRVSGTVIARGNARTPSRPTAAG
jgi:hypothetical protein